MIDAPFAAHTTSQKKKLADLQNSHIVVHIETSHLPDVPEPPDPLRSLLVDRTAAAREFRQQIRKYNSALGFVSLGAQIDVKMAGGPPVFFIHGAVRRSISTLPMCQSEPSYAQLYIIESNDANRHRATTFPDLDKRVLKTLSTMLQNTSPFPRMLKSMQDIIDEHMTTSDQAMPSFHLGFVSGKTPEPHRYNKPSSAEEVACVFVAKDGAPPHNRDIVVYPRDEAVVRIPANSDHVIPLTYPLLFPYGDCGWQPDLQHASEYRSRVYHR